ncbi:RDD family protein [Halobacteriovorax sp.]|uniref:RDD family protein n=1 Tax=Halobacteriovorax sp. TaxID=2020862 RepID=UPI003563E2ED
MENLNSNENKEAKDVVFNNEFNLDDFDFKPLNEGLGFHHEERKNGILPQANKRNQHISVSRETSATTRTTNLGVSNEGITRNGLESMNSLSAFYSESQNIEEAPKLEVSDFEPKAKEIVTASSAKQFSAWILDILIVACITASLMALFVAVSGLSFIQFYEVIGQNDLAIFVSVSFSIFYLSYFSILDLQATPGKSLLKLRLIREDGKPVLLKDSFLRSFITLLSFVTLGLPCLIDFQGKLTDTKVKEDV